MSAPLAAKRTRLKNSPCGGPRLVADVGKPSWGVFLKMTQPLMIDGRLPVRPMVPHSLKSRHLARFRALRLRAVLAFSHFHQGKAILGLEK
jgi:hypothetical protein